MVPQAHRTAVNARVLDDTVTVAIWPLR